MSQLNKNLTKKVSLGLTVITAGAIFISSYSYAFSAQLLVPIAGITDTGVSLTTYVEKVYIWGIGLAALLAVLMIVIGGAQYIFAAGSFGEAEAGKSRITSAIYGIILLLGISLILSTVGVRLRNITLDPLALDPNNQDMQRLLDDLLTDDKISRATTLTGYNFADLSQLNEIAGKARALESAKIKGTITQAQYDANLLSMHEEFNDHFNSPALFEKLKKSNEDAFKAINYPYTEASLTESVKAQIAQKREFAFGIIIADLKDTKNPLILDQQKINSGRASTSTSPTSNP